MQVDKIDENKSKVLANVDDKKKNLKPKKKLRYSGMVPLKWSITFEPPQLALLYKKSEKEQKKQLFVIQLNGLIFLGDPDKITRILFKKHSDYLSLDKVSYNQVRSLIVKLLEYMQDRLMEYEDDEENPYYGMNPEEMDMTPEEYIEAVRMGHIQPTPEMLQHLGMLGEYDEEDEGFDEADIDTIGVGK